MCFALAAAVSPLLSGCSAQLASLPIVGEPEGTPKRPAEEGVYPNIGEKRERDLKSLTPAERQAVEADLAARRERQINQARDRDAADAAAQAAEAARRSGASR